MTDLYDLNTRNKIKRDTMKRFWICFVEGTDGRKHYAHWTFEETKGEAERLTRKEGKAVFVFECISKCIVGEPPVKWVYPN